jgi:hypothetical protein
MSPKAYVTVDVTTRPVEVVVVVVIGVAVGDRVEVVGEIVAFEELHAAAQAMSAQTLMKPLARPRPPTASRRCGIAIYRTIYRQRLGGTHIASSLVRQPQSGESMRLRGLVGSAPNRVRLWRV